MESKSFFFVAQMNLYGEFSMAILYPATKFGQVIMLLFLPPDVSFSPKLVNK